MDFNDLLVDAFGRVRDAVHGAVDGCSQAALAYRPDADANSIAWLVWHLTRIQDDHIADVAGTEQVWTAADWFARFALPFDPADHGYGHDTRQVAALGGATAELLLGYHDAVHDATVRYVRGLTTSDLDRIVDERWDPPVSLAVRLVSVVADNLEHAGQAAYVRGVAHRNGVD
jgi:Protein of unknown function (DUF664)